MDGDEYNILDEFLLCDSATNSAQSINDGDVNTVWVSGLNATDQLPYNISLDFEVPVIFISSSITWHSVTPLAMKLERYNGTDWLPYRYYAEDCPSSIYQMDNSLVDSSLTSDIDPICVTTEQFQNTTGFVVSDTDWSVDILHH